MWAFPMNRDGNGATGALAKMEGSAGWAGGTIIYFVLGDDCVNTARRALRSRWPNSEGQVPIGEYGNIALVSDLDGNVVGFHSMA